MERVSSAFPKTTPENVEDFFLLSRHFAEQSGLMTREVKKVIRRCDAAGVPSGMTMLGNGVFAYGRKARDVLLPFGHVYEFHVVSYRCTYYGGPDMIPADHPRYHSLVTRERLAECAKKGIVSWEGLTAHGRGEAFDYLIGERTTRSALIAERTAAAMLLTARHPVISVNGNTAALAAHEISAFQKACGARVEVNLFHRTEARVNMIENLLRECRSRCILR